jgi:hypothetical protein
VAKMVCIASSAALCQIQSDVCASAPEPSPSIGIGKGVLDTLLGCRCCRQIMRVPVGAHSLYSDPVAILRGRGASGDAPTWLGEIVYTYVDFP